MDNQIFYDPQRKRWKRLRRIMDILALVSFVVMIVFAVSVVHRQELPDLSLPATKHNYKPVTRPEDQKAKALKAQRRRSARKPSDITLNSGEGLRAAYYVEDDPASYASLREHISQIDLLFPEWLHVDANSGQVLATTLDGRNFSVVDTNGVHDPDSQGRIKRLIHNAKEDTEIFPLLSNFSNAKNNFDPAMGVLLQDPVRRAALRQTLMRFLNGFPAYRGFSLDFEDLNDQNNDAYNAFVTELGADLHARGLKLYVNVAHWEVEDNLRVLSAASDALLLMNYDEHNNSSKPGPVAGQDWFVENLKRWLKVVPKQKIICAVGNYGYDWSLSIPNPKDKHHATSKVVGIDVLGVQEAWQRAADSEADLELADIDLNPHYEYVDEDAHVRHEVWFLDAVTLLNEMRAARSLGIGTFALWRLGSEDRSLWQIWDHPRAADAPSLLSEVPPGHDVDTEGEGDILRVTGVPKSGKRVITLDTSEPDPAQKLILDEKMDTWPKSYVVQQYGYNPKKLAISFDDGPDPKWTPKILDILKKQHVKAVFMMIGAQAEENVRLMQRVVAEGHEIGNHTFTHPDISEISQRQLQLELNLTERLFASKLGIQPLFFRPPYSIDQEPDTDDQAEPAARIQNLGYIIVGDKLDTNDWDENPRKSPQEITNGILTQLDGMKEKSWLRGSIILMHDGGGDRSATVAALPVLIQALRARGYEIVPVSELMGKTTAEVMPPIRPDQRLSAWVDSVAFFGFAFFGHFIVGVFFVGDVLMSIRLLLIGVLALIDRLKPRRVFQPGFEPQVAVLVPAYNEETVIVRTIRSVLNSDYPNLRVIVIDDGSKDKTSEVARAAYADEIASGRLTVLTKPNGGKAAALNYAIENLTEEFYVGIDADTVIAPDAVSKLIRHFANPLIGAVAGNAKVGNRVNLWTRWQALEYITSQNFERRALDLFGVVTVVPGAIGAWRTAAIRASGCYPMNTVAEDADLSMSLLEHQYKVIYEDSALAFTEAPINMDGLMRQRFRWSFGTLQAIWKHRGAFLNNKAMGLFALPNILVFQMILPLVSPFIDLMFIAGFLHFLVDRYFHPEAASAANFQRLCVYFLAFLVIDFVTSSLAFSLERRHPANKGDGWLLFHIWLQRFAYRQVFSLVLFKTIKRAIDGRPFNWDKLERTAKMSKQTEELTRGS